MWVTWTNARAKVDALTHYSSIWRSEPWKTAPILIMHPTKIHTVPLLSPKCLMSTADNSHVRKKTILFVLCELWALSNESDYCQPLSNGVWIATAILSNICSELTIIIIISSSTIQSNATTRTFYVSIQVYELNEISHFARRNAGTWQIYTYKYIYIYVFHIWINICWAKYCVYMWMQLYMKYTKLHTKFIQMQTQIAFTHTSPSNSIIFSYFQHISARKKKYQSHAMPLAMGKPVRAICCCFQPCCNYNTRMHRWQYNISAIFVSCVSTMRTHSQPETRRCIGPTLYRCVVQQCATEWERASQKHRIGIASGHTNVDAAH